MRRLALASAVASLVIGCAHPPELQSVAGPYTVQRKVRAGGAGGFDYVYADVAGRRLYVPRGAPGPRVMVLDLETLDSVGTLSGINARGAAVSAVSHHGFASSKPVAMWDTRTLAQVRSIDVQGGPDGILYDTFNDRVWVFSHSAPHATVINAADGTVVGTVDLGGAPEQAVSDGKGHIYVDVEDKENVAVVDAASLTVTAHYDVTGKGGTCAGLAIDIARRLLFATCRNPATMVVMSADDGHVITTLPIGSGTDGAVFNPATMEVFSSNSDGTLTIVKETSPTSFAVTQTLVTTPGAKTLTLDAKTNRILLIAAEYGAPPAQPAPGGRPNRGPMVPGSFTVWVVGR